MINQLKSEYELKVRALETKIEDMKSDFGKQRSKSLNIILSTESENKLLKDQIDSLIAEQRQHLLEINKLREEQSNVHCILQTTQSMEQNDIYAIKQNYEQEMASLKQAYILQIQDYKEQLHIYANERRKYLSEREHLIRKMTEKNSNTNDEEENEKSLDKQSKQCLDDEMKKAQKESVLLKEVVVPMEQEIEKLKVQLTEANRRLSITDGALPLSHLPEQTLLLPNTDLIKLDDSGEYHPRVHSDPFMSTILGSATDLFLQPGDDDDDDDNNDDDDSDGPTDIMKLSSLGVVQAVLDISKANTERSSKKDMQDTVTHLEVKLKSCEQKNEDMVDLYDEVLTTKNQLFEKNFALTDHLTKLARELQRERKYLFIAKKMIDTAYATMESYIQPKNINDEDWKIFIDKLGNIELSENLNPFNNSNEDTNDNNNNNIFPKDPMDPSPVEMSTLSDTVEKLKGELDKSNTKNDILARANKSLNDKLKRSESDASEISDADPQSIYSKQLTLLKTTCDTLKQSYEKEKRMREEMRKTFRSQQSELSKIKTEYEFKDSALNEIFNEIKEELIAAKKDSQAQIAALVDDREKLVNKIRELEGKCNQLTASRKLEMNEYSQRLDQEIYYKSEAERNVATLQTQLDSILEDKNIQEDAQTAKVESLISLVENYESQKTTDLLKHNMEVKDLKDKALDRKQLNTQLEIISKTKNELLSENKRLEDIIIQIKNEFQTEVNELKQSIKMLKDVNSNLNGVTVDQESQLSKLKTDLNVSQEVQKDFVTMTQQLQIQMINFEEERKLIKWEFEEDIEKCHNCNHKFDEIRTKSRCKRCCLILCKDCTKWITQTAKNRDVSVCEDCYKMSISGSHAVVSKTNPKSLSYPKK